MLQRDIYIVLIDSEEGFCAFFYVKEGESREAREMDVFFIDKGGFESGFGEEELGRGQLREEFRL